MNQTRRDFLLDPAVETVLAKLYYWEAYMASSPTPFPFGGWGTASIDGDP